MAGAMALRPMGLLEIVDQTFRLYRRNFLVFFGIAAVIYIPTSLLETVPVLAMLAGVIFMPLYLIASGALTKAVSDRYLGEEASVGEAYRYVAKRFWPFIITMLAAYLLVLAGIALLIVGAIVFAFWVMFVPQVFIIEGKRNFEAVWRSRFLISKGVWAELVVLMMIVGALGALIGGALGAALGAPTGFWAGEEGFTVVFSVIYGLVQALVLPISQIATVLLYYDSRMRKEGFDLEMLAKEMGVAMAAGPTAPPDQAGSGGASAEAGQQM